MSYARFAAMIVTSTVVMFILMYLNTYALEHLFFSETRSYMAVLMGATMAVIMLGFMLRMYTDTTLNLVILAGSVFLFATSLYLVRGQATVSGPSYMRAMIPHHSIAIMTSERARIEDARVRKLADEIIDAQRREIAEMRYLIEDINARGITTDVFHDGPPQAGSIADAIGNSLKATFDLAPLSGEEAAKVIEAGVCGFHYSVVDDPVLWVSADGARGAIKLNGVIVAMDADGARFSTEGAEATVDAADSARANADLVFRMAQGPTIGYRGTWTCDS